MTSAGAGIFRLVTSGMYDNPLAVYREYIQNAADSLAQSGASGGSVVVGTRRPVGNAQCYHIPHGRGRIGKLSTGGGRDKALLPVAQSRTVRWRRG